MIKIQKTNKNGEICEFWELTDEDKAKMKAESEKRKAEIEARKDAKREAAKSLKEKLEALAQEASLVDKFEELYNGAVINTGEKRLVLHQLTRGQLGDDVVADGINKREFYVNEQKKIAEFAESIKMFIWSHFSMIFQSFYRKNSLRQERFPL